MSEPESPVTENDLPQDEDETSSPQDPYEREIDRYRTALNRDMETTCRRYGFTMYHSIPGVDVVELRQRLGFPAAEATDLYNLGVVAAQKEDFEKAAEYFQQALKADPELAEAEFNLALAYEKLDNRTAAKKQWASFLKREGLNEEDDMAASERLQELG